MPSASGAIRKTITPDIRPPNAGRRISQIDREVVDPNRVERADPGTGSEYPVK
jgi:hypothetical protein